MLATVIIFVSVRESAAAAGNAPGDVAGISAVDVAVGTTVDATLLSMGCC